MSDEDALKAAHAASAPSGSMNPSINVRPLNSPGGEKRKVAIAGILAFHPDILVVDEPTAGLDPLGLKP
jgi:energy-coupling factor transport system ATP-binding protein